MKNVTLKSLLSLALCLALLAAAALCTVSVAESKASDKKDAVILMNGTREEPVVLGEGKTVFLFQVVDLDEKESWFEIHTDAADVGSALLENGLVAGDMSEEYGLFVNIVCGIDYTWSTDPYYFWKLYVNDVLAEAEVSQLAIEPDMVYSYRIIPFTY